MATNKTRIQKAERKVEAARKEKKPLAAALRLRAVNYRTGLSPEFPEPPNADILIRFIDLTETKDKDNE